MPKPNGYLPQLDGLRALAVLAVLGTHFLPGRYWPLGVYWGAVGVRLFFVLSGFLITGLLLRESEGAARTPGERGFLLRHFYLRRILRLAPVYYLTLGVMFALNAPNTRTTVWWHVFYLSNVNFALTGSWHGYVAHFWSLAVEEQFYLIWPLALLFVPRRPLVGAALCLLPGAIFYRWAAHHWGWTEMAAAALPPSSMDALIVGALIALGVRWGRLSARQPQARPVALIGLVFWCVSIFFGTASGVIDYAGDTGLALFFGWVVLRAADNDTGLPWRFLQNRVLIYLGKISYGVYVVHNLVDFLFLLRLRAFFSPLGDPAAAIAVALGLSLISIGFAATSWHLLEVPINRYRRSLPYRRSGAL